MSNARPLVRLPTSRRWTIDDARTVVAAHAASGLSARAFARREGIDVQRLRRWARVIGDADDVTPEMPSFIEVAPPRDAIVEVVLRNGRLLRVGASIDASALTRIADALDGGDAC